LTLNPHSAGSQFATSRKSHVFVFIAVILGFAELVSIGFNWHSADSRRFVIYLILTFAASFVHLKRIDRSGGFSLSLPFVLLSIVDLSTRESVAIGCLAVAIQNLRAPEAWSFRRLGLSLGVQATIIATASFMFHSLLPGWVKDSPLRLFIAAVALFIANTFPAAIMLRFTGRQRLGELWRSSYFWAFPYYLVAGALAQMLHQGRSAVSSSSSLLALIALYLAYRHYRAQKAEWKIRAKHADDVAALHLRAIEGLALAVEAKDNMNTRGHIRRVQVYALAIGKSMGLKGPELDALQAGSLLHDIGKLAVPEHILTKPGKLTQEEFAKMKVHPLVGAEIVEQMKFPYPVAPIVRSHHEKWDGSGYPYGLKGEDIPLGARILTVADWLDAMISDREYRKGIPLEDAMQQIVAEAGKSFDPAVVEALQPQYQVLERTATRQAAQGPILSTDVQLENQSTPGAGLEMVGLPDGAHGEDFLATINAAGREQQLLSATAEAATSLDPAETMRRIEEALRTRIPHDALAFFVPEANLLKAEFAAGDQHEHLLDLEVPLGEGLIGWVGQNLQPVVNGNPAVDPGFRCDSGEPLQSVLAVPLRSGERLVAVLALYRIDKDSFARAEFQLVSAVQANIASALQNAFAYREAESKANLDQLTGLLNRPQFVRHLDEELSIARRTRQPLALVISELPAYAELAASVGDRQADDLLIAISKGLRQASRERDRLGRIKENRFALVLPRVKAAHVIAILDRMGEITNRSSAAVFGRPIVLKSAGAFYPDDGDGARHLLAVVEQRLEASSQRWEESLRALLHAGGPSVDTTAPAELDVARFVDHQ
jgi:diguanylate cyclase (GGDEF)-like protein/putative nucleotidyltransferase with HDIG domain